MDLVVPSFQVDLGEVCCFTQAVDQVIHSLKWKPALDGDHVDGARIGAHPLFFSLIGC